MELFGDNEDPEALELTISTEERALAEKDDNNKFNNFFNQ